LYLLIFFAFFPFFFFFDCFDVYFFLSLYLCDSLPACGEGWGGGYV
jgi:hypothetical protein